MLSSTDQPAPPTSNLEEDTPERDAYLRRFADADGKRFMWPYYKDFHGLDPNEAMIC